MQYIEAPYLTPIHNKVSIFLGGGISNCGDWQATAAKRMFDAIGQKKFTVINPRRKAFDISKQEETEFQITWEHRLLRETTINFFWFPKDTVCPITLFELGSALERKTNEFDNLIIGTEKDYCRRIDVVCQAKLQGYSYEVFDSFDKIVAEAIYRIGALSK